MTTRTKPRIDGHNTTFTKIAEQLGISRQAVQQKYNRVAQHHSHITLDMLRERHQSPVVAQRKEDNQLVYHRERIIRHALINGRLTRR
ncbi:hypothetical protein [Xanthomonas phage JGB6]|nr:hypothetical protein [Xanthomonas phage JGB6]